MTHERFTSPRIGELLAAVESSDLVKNAESDEAVNAREDAPGIRSRHEIPPDLVEEMAHGSAGAAGMGRRARKKSQFKLFQPWLSKTVDLKKREAKCVG